jgi:hypothetical protein
MRGVVAGVRPLGGRGERPAADAHRRQGDQQRIAVDLLGVDTLD